MAPDVFNLLKADHKELEDLFAKLTSTSQRAVKTRAGLVSKLKTALEIHSRVEESVFYPALHEMELTHPMTLESLEQHKLIRQLMSELELMSVQDEGWHAKLKLLHENFQSHIKEEEAELFLKAREIFSSGQMETLGQRLQSAKQEAKSSVE